MAAAGRAGRGAPLLKGLRGAAGVRCQAGAAVRGAGGCVREGLPGEMSEVGERPLGAGVGRVRGSRWCSSESVREGGGVDGTRGLRVREALSVKCNVYFPKVSWGGQGASVANELRGVCWLCVGLKLVSSVKLYLISLYRCVCSFKVSGVALFCALKDRVPLLRI